jgi:putative tryptophan/tyrosine transport system substrate-binding protein
MSGIIARRQFMAALGSAAAWPIAARGQQRTTPVIGFLNAASAETYANRLRGFHDGLKDSGFVDGDNLTILYRWANNQMDRLPELAADLVRRRVAVIVTGTGTAPAVAAKQATSTIPVVFVVAEDPVRIGLVASLAHPGGHMTGVNFLNSELAAKRLEFLHELVPTAHRIGLLVNPTNGPNTETVLKDVEPAARAIGLETQVLNASTIGEIDQVFTGFEMQQPDALFVSGDNLFNNRRVQLALLAARYRIPAAYSSRDYPEYGGLMSYGTNVTEAFHQAGLYAGSILKGAKPAELPVVQASKFELVINRQTARVLGLSMPQTLLVAADEVIE